MNKEKVKKDERKAKSDLIALLYANLHGGNEIGLQDKNGEEICEGDIVRFHYGERVFLDPSTFDYDHKDATEMIDIVRWIDGKYYFICNLGMGSFASTHNKRAEVIGSIYQGL